jgi:hypothetical protein
MRGRENFNDQDGACLLIDSVWSTEYSKEVTETRAWWAILGTFQFTIYRPGQICCLVTMSLCFLEAFQEKQKGDITEQEYIHHLFVHCQGIEHEGDDWTKRDWDLLETDWFGYSVRSWSLRVDHVKGNSI